VFGRFVEGQSTKQTALGLRISPKIAETNWRQIAKKHGVHSITEMIKYAIGGSFTAVEFQPLIQGAVLYTAFRASDGPFSFG